MQFIAALFEHFVVGIFALIWIFPLTKSYGFLENDYISKILGNKEIFVALMLPFSYILGMYLDAVASLFQKTYTETINYLAKTINFFFCKLCNDSCTKIFAEKESKNILYSSSSYQNTIHILNNGPEELSRYFLQLNSRSKIARGISLNLIIWLTLIYNDLTNFQLLIAKLILFGSFLASYRFDKLLDIFKENYKKPENH